MNKTRAIAGFWEWFSTHSKGIIELYEGKQFDQLSSLMNSKLDAIDSELPWEVGPGVHTEYSFTLSPEGNTRLEALVSKVLANAPQLEQWEFYSSRQPRTAPAVVRLPARGRTFSTGPWRFVPTEDLTRGQIDVTVIDENLSSVGREDGLKAVSIFLDQFLGERTVEDWIGRIQIVGAQTEPKSYPIQDLADYILWARNREQNPLRHEGRD